MAGEAAVPERKGPVARRVRTLGEILQAHAGGLELVYDHDHEVTVRFTGMCTGCPLRSVTFSGLVKPALMALDAVDSVSAEGVRLSAEAEARLARQIDRQGSARILAAIERNDGEEG